MTRTMFALGLIGLLATGATASAAGLNLSWDDCGVHGTGLRVFACDTDAGYQDLIASVVAGADMPQVIGIEVVAYLYVGPGSTLPDWWLLGTGQCRAGAASLDLDYDDDPTTCPWILGTDVGVAGGYAWDAPYVSSHQARLRWAIALPLPGRAIQGDTEYTVGRLRIRNAGAGTCGGCDVPACIGLSRVRIAQPAGIGDLLVSMIETRSHVGWQCPSEQYSETSETCSVSSCGTPATNPTWGMIKSMYR